MPSLITHAMIGTMSAKAVSGGEISPKFWALSVLCAVIPDADVIAFSFGIPYGHFFGHRGFFHSICFGLILGLLVVTLFFRAETWATRHWWLLVMYFSLLTASHGILDAFTNGGLGIALLSPFDTSRYFFPVTPIQVAPISVRAFMSSWGVRVMVSEFVWVWVPTLVMFAVYRWGIRDAG